MVTVRAEPLPDPEESINACTYGSTTETVEMFSLECPRVEKGLTSFYRLERFPYVWCLLVIFGVQVGRGYQTSVCC